eukprot:8920864-Pyramimonas_sp.AAC.1
MTLPTWMANSVALIVSSYEVKYTKWLGCYFTRKQVAQSAQGRLDVMRRLDAPSRLRHRHAGHSQVGFTHHRGKSRCRVDWLSQYFGAGVRSIGVLCGLAKPSRSEHSSEPAEVTDPYLTPIHWSSTFSQVPYSRRRPLGTLAAQRGSTHRPPFRKGRSSGGELVSRRFGASWVRESCEWCA